MTQRTLSPAAIDYPSGDGKPLAENDWQLRAICDSFAALDHHFAGFQPADGRRSASGPRGQDVRAPKVPAVAGRTPSSRFNSAKRQYRLRLPYSRAHILAASAATIHGKGSGPGPGPGPGPGQFPHSSVIPG